jgi:DNA-binding transcriptional ArsR family regulator
MMSARADAVFRALADETRRALLDRLYERQGQTLGELCDGLAMSRQSITKHLAVLERADLVSTHWEGREKLHYLNPVPIAEAAERWIDKFSQARSRAILALKAATEEENDEPPRVRVRSGHRRAARA